MSAFANRVALVTGAGSGIGRQLALDLTRAGAAVAALDLTPEPLTALGQELAGKRFAWALGDVTERDSVGKAVAQLEESLGPIDLLIANAGIGRETSALQFKAADFEAQIRVNLIGVANSIEAVLPGMIQRRSGHLVAMSSLASYHGLPFMAGYCASKAGVNAMMDGLRVELQPLGIAVTTLCPGWIRTPLTQHSDFAKFDMLEVADATRLMLDAIRRRRPFYAFPGHGVRRVRLLKWLPTSWGDWLVRRMLAARVKR
jgi:NAD(P)-dependent dehydrogenase (short-subunit alcohol dehydrogenase family)